MQDYHTQPKRPSVPRRIRELGWSEDRSPEWEAELIGILKRRPDPPGWRRQADTKEAPNQGGSSVFIDNISYFVNLFDYRLFAMEVELGRAHKFELFSIYYLDKMTFVLAGIFPSN